MRKKFLITSLALLTVFFSTGCASQKDKNLSQTSSNTEITDNKLKEENIKLKGEIEQLQKQIKIEKEIADIVESSELTLAQEISEDLDGDGTPEAIKLECDGGGNLYRLSINNLSITSYGSNIKRTIEIVDIDKKDSLKEIAIPELGPSDDLYTHFYKYNPRVIDYVGTLGGIQERGLTVNGDGTITATRRGKILHTWFYETRYAFKEGSILEEIVPKNGMYSMGNYELKVIKEIPIYKANKRDKLKDLKVGEKVYLKESDDSGIVVVETTNKELGYIMIEGYYNIKNTNLNAPEVFEGLCYAD